MENTEALEVKAALEALATSLRPEMAAALLAASVPLSSNGSSDRPYTKQQCGHDLPSHGAMNKNLCDASTTRTIPLDRHACLKQPRLGGKKRLPLISTVLLAAVLVSPGALVSAATVYYIDSKNGADEHDGVSVQSPWRTVGKIGALTLRGGDQVLLKRGSTFSQTLKINKALGSLENPAIVDAYGTGANPIISVSAGDGVLVMASSFLEIRNLELINGGVNIPFIRTQATFQHLILSNLYIHNIFSGTHKGIVINHEKTRDPGSRCSDVLVTDCRIERVQTTGILASRLRDASFINNHITDVGFCGIIANQSQNLIIRSNVVDHPGCTNDARMNSHKGDGGYIMGCKNVLVERNTFMNARDYHADGAGFHVDVNNSNVIYQHNLSVSNNGGFAEILGNNSQCVFRYNISVNDGWRVRDDAHKVAEGKCFFLTGWTVNAGYHGPSNCYLYNNSIYVDAALPSTFHFGKTLSGVLIANNIFHLRGVVTDSTKLAWGNKDSKVTNVFFKNNLYVRQNLLPPTLLIHDESPMIGDVQFQSPGGIDAKDYIPTARELVKDKGIVIPLLPGDNFGVTGGLAPSCDYFGNPITGLPDLGAVELVK